MFTDAFLIEFGRKVMNILKSIKDLTIYERVIWISSLILILTSFVLFESSDYLTVIASLVGATALIFVGKGDAIGQLLTIVFTLLYAIISFGFRYYGEMLTYLAMTAPSALVAMINWLRHPYTKREVAVSKIQGKQWFFLMISAVVVTIILGFILSELGTTNLMFSTLSVTTSYLASMLTIFRSRYYAIAYALNDIILIILWILATMENINYMPMIICFIIFLVNDTYGYIHWKVMEERQQKDRI